MALNFQDPPESAISGGTRVTKWGSFTAELRANPNRWAFVGRKPSKTAAVTLANAIASGRRPEFEPNGAFESKWAEMGDSYNVWVRYVGGESADDDEDDGGDGVWDDEDVDDAVAVG
jgi:hypothetical protein